MSTSNVIPDPEKFERASLTGTSISASYPNPDEDLLGVQHPAQKPTDTGVARIRPPVASNSFRAPRRDRGHEPDLELRQRRRRRPALAREAAGAAAVLLRLAYLRAERPDALVSEERRWLLERERALFV